MKKALALLAALTLMGAANIWAAATVTLSNYDSNMPIFYNAVGTLAPLDGTFVELIGPNGPVTPTGGGSSILSLAEPGFFDGGFGVVPGVADSAQAALTLRAWRGAATWDVAAERGEVSWTQATGAWDPTAVPPAAPSGPALAIPSSPLIVVPEPSTIALGILGGAALLLFRRK